MKNRKSEYRAKVTDDSGLIRGRVPVPLLKVLGARRGDRITFRLDDSNNVTMHVSRSRKKSSKGAKRR